MVGRVCCDTDKGRLNPSSVMLEGSIEYSEGQLARLDLSKIPSCSLFPGQASHRLSLALLPTAFLVLQTSLAAFAKN